GSLHTPNRRLVATARRDGCRLLGLRPVLHLGGIPERALLLGPLHLAVLFALHRLQLRRARQRGHRRQVVGPVAGPPGAGVPTGLPPHVLLLPEGVLPVVLAFATGLRCGGAPRPLPRSDPLSADPPEHPSA